MRETSAETHRLLGVRFDVRVVVVVEGLDASHGLRVDRDSTDDPALYVPASVWKGAVRHAVAQMLGPEATSPFGSPDRRDDILTFDLRAPADLETESLDWTMRSRIRLSPGGPSADVPLASAPYARVSFQAPATFAVDLPVGREGNDRVRWLVSWLPHVLDHLQLGSGAARGRGRPESIVADRPLFRPCLGRWDDVASGAGIPLADLTVEEGLPSGPGGQTRRPVLWIGPPESGRLIGRHRLAELP